MDDFPDWEILEIHDDKKISPRKHHTDHHDQPEHVVKNYLTPTPPKAQEFVDPTNQIIIPEQILPVPIQSEKTIVTTQDHELVKEDTPDEIKKTSDLVDDQDPDSHDLFNKEEGPEFDDTKTESPVSSSRGIVEQNCTGGFGFEDEAKNSALGVGGDEDMGMKDSDFNKKNAWNWSLSGISAICSFSFVAAAGVCMILIGSSQMNKQQKQNRKLRFQICADDKRIRQVVQQASKLSVRGVPMARAQITFGGYYEGV